MFSAVSWVAGHRVSGVVCSVPNTVGCGGCVLCVRAFKFVLCRVELEPVPCVFYLHLNEARGDLPSVSLSLSLSQSNRHWSLCEARWPVVLFSSSKVSPLFHMYLRKALTPHTAAMSEPSACGPHFPCTIVCVCVSALVWVRRAQHRAVSVHAMRLPVCVVGVCIYVSIYFYRVETQQRMTTPGKRWCCLSLFQATAAFSVGPPPLQLNVSESIWPRCESDYRAMNGSLCCLKMDWGVLIYFVTPLPHFSLLEPREKFSRMISHLDFK